jgi:hypothetical protein
MVLKWSDRALFRLAAFTRTCPRIAVTKYDYLSRFDHDDVRLRYARAAHQRDGPERTTH